MRLPIKRWLAVVALVITAALGWLALSGTPQGAATSASTGPRGEIGLFTSLPLLWSEGEVGDLLKSSEAPHWALAVLGEAGKPVPLDRLADSPAFRRVQRLIMAQPRPLAPDENVALDAWVRGGGHLLLFADPMLTGESDYALGDPRRPQDVVLVSPLLGHWGLELQFDEDQPADERTAPALGQTMPVNLAGHLRLKGEGSACTLLDQGLLAECRIGKGQALIVADAALLERGAEVDEATRAEVLRALLKRAFIPAH